MLAPAPAPAPSSLNFAENPLNRQEVSPSVRVYQDSKAALGVPAANNPDPALQSEEVQPLEAQDSSFSGSDNRAPIPGNPVLSEADALLGGMQWLGTQPDGYFSLQLFASRSREKSQAFISTHAKGRDFHLVPSIRAGVTWYVVISGSYSNHQRASDARGSLLRAGEKIDPWIRKVADIKRLAETRQP
jgi:septal ring-binding cell division protein DamX